MQDNEFYTYLTNEYNQPFSGWDFSYLTGRMEDIPPHCSFFAKRRKIFMHMTRFPGNDIISLVGEAPRYDLGESVGPDLRLAELLDASG